MFLKYLETFKYELLDTLQKEDQYHHLCDRFYSENWRHMQESFLKDASIEALKNWKNYKQTGFKAKIFKDETVKALIKAREYKNMLKAGVMLA